MAERKDIKLQSGEKLHMLTDGEGYAFGYIAMEPNGHARIWRQTWVDEYAPTQFTYPGFVSAARAVIRGEV